MGEDEIISLNTPEETNEDVPAELVGNGARKILEEALEAEIESFPAQYRELGSDDGYGRIVRNGYLPEREIVAEIGKTRVKAPGSRDRRCCAKDERIIFSSGILPRYLRKTKSVEELILWLCLGSVPAEHWQHIRTTNPIESTFATVRHRTKGVKGCLFAQTPVNMAFKLCQSAERKWKKLKGHKRLAEVIEGVSFVDGISEKELAA